MNIINTRPCHICKFVINQLALDTTRKSPQYSLKNRALISNFCNLSISLSASNQEKEEKSSIGPVPAKPRQKKRSRCFFVGAVSSYMIYDDNYAKLSITLRSQNNIGPLGFQMNHTSNGKKKKERKKKGYLQNLWIPNEPHLKW